MKILLFLTGYRQLEEYNYFNLFLKNLKLNNICDIYIYCNNPNISSEIITYYKNFNQNNKQLFITTLNSGHVRGGVEAVSKAIDMGIFKDYDYVLHLHPDVFITDDKYLISVLEEHLHDDIVFFITKSFPHDQTMFSFDFFIFKPKLLFTNIFMDELYTFNVYPEIYLHNMINKYNIKYTFIKRYDNDDWIPRRIDENLKLYHEHDLSKIKEILNIV